jgi:hypothetical protein
MVWPNCPAGGQKFDKPGEPWCNHRVRRDDLASAGELLFGRGYLLPADLGDEAWQCELREAYRRRVLDTHPDRAAVLGRDPEALSREFEAVCDAYRRLCPTEAPFAVDAPAPCAPRRRTAPSAPQGRQPVDHVHRGSLPRRPLLFAEYLYYAGRVSWRNLVEAVAWQRRQRPAVGRIAVQWGHLRDDEVRRVLAAGRAARVGGAGEPFGETARRLGLLTSVQLLAILGRQRRLQRRIGEFFLEAGLVEASEIGALQAECSRHNARCRR